MKTKSLILLALASLLVTVGCASEDNGQGGSYKTTEHNQGQANSIRSPTNSDRDYSDHRFYYVH